MISHRFWQSRLGGSRAVGRTLVFNGQPYTVLGVLPPSLRAVPGFGLSPEVYLPLSAGLMPEIDTDASAVKLIGRLRDDQSLEQGRARPRRRGSPGRGQRVKEFGSVAKFARAEGLADSFDEIGIFFAVLSVAVAWCWQLRARTWPACCFLVRPCGAVKSRYAPRSAPAVGG